MRSRKNLRRHVALASALVAGAATVAVAVTSAVTTASAAASDSYSWKNVRIDGGGFVPGIVFNQTEPNLIYARTDIGGLYRWNEAGQSWVPLLDWVGYDKWGWNGVASVATDPVQTNKVYAAVGMYTNDWDPNNGAILRSSDKGATWQATELPFKLGGNMPGRGMGERLAIDPNRNSILYLAAPSGNGLWRSTDSGVTWAKVTAFPNVGNYVAVPGDSYQGDNQGVVWVTFDPSTGTAGNTTQTIYVGVADKNNTVYRSTNGGSTWSAVPGAPTGYIAHKGVLDHVNHYLYLATSDTGGPYDGGHGEVWRLNTATGAWTEISPVPDTSSDQYFGYSGLTIDRQHPGTIMVSTQISWWPDMITWRSTDSGATWTKIWDWTSYPNRSFRYTMDISSVPWLSLGANPSPPEVTPKLGWMNESMEIDPFNSDRMMYGTGATIYGTTNLTNWDSNTPFTIKPMVKGLEETAVLDLISPPTGTSNLISGLGDIGGFRHTNLDAVPAMMFQQPYFTSTTSLDYAELNPSYMVRAGSFTDADRPNDSHVAFSTDGGANWFQGQEPGGVNNGGTVAAAADGSRFVWSPGDAGQQVIYSVGFGQSWQASTGVPANSVIESDRVNPQKFYAFSAGKFYVSTNGGQSFTQTAASGLPTTGNVKFKALPGVEGDIWLAGGDATSTSGLWRSTNSGASFTRVSAATAGVNVGFGKAAPGQTYPAVFAYATIDGVQGVFRSDNIGQTWVRINDNAHQYGNAAEALTGDPRIYGRVYLGTNGRGILYADRLGGTTQPPPSSSVVTSRPPTSSVVTSRPPTSSVVTSRPPTSSVVTSRPPTSAVVTSRPPTSSVVTSRPPTSSVVTSRPPTSAVVTTGSTGNCVATYTVTNSWQGGFQGDVTVKNNRSTASTSWTVIWTFANGQTVTQLWGGKYTQTGSAVTVTNEAWNGNLGANATVDIGFNGSHNGNGATKPSQFKLNGAGCS